MVNLRGILESALYCDDLEAARAFYSGILDLELIDAQEGRHLIYRCGDNILLLFDPEHTRKMQRDVGGDPIPLHGAKGPGHLAFSVSIDEVVAWRERLIAENVAIESEITWSSGARSIYFRDPAGNSLEITSPELWI